MRPMWQSGFLRTEHGSWVGFWYEYRKDSSGKKRRYQKRQKIGPCSDITEERARVLLQEIVNKRLSQSRLLSIANHSALTETFHNVQLQECKSGNKGAIAELLIAADLMHKGCQVYRALSHSASCDLLAMFGETIYRVEVKMAGIKESGAYKRNLKLKRGAFDVLAVVSNDLRSITYYGENRFNHSYAPETKEGGVMG